jgi:hypothetical protein
VWRVRVLDRDGALGSLGVRNSIKGGATMSTL